jgi:hypothetical protein
VLGALIRLYLVIFTQGTADTPIWHDHAAGVNKLGIMGYYRSNPYANHPPSMFFAASWILKLSEAAGIPFRILFRLPFCFVDAGITVLLIALIMPRTWRFVAGTCYWLHPLSLIYSAYHGNTDIAIPFFLLLSVWFLSKENFMGAAVAAGFGFWIKIPGAPAIPALLILVPTWRKKFIFLCTTGLVAVLPYAPALMQDPDVVYANVFGYRGLMIHTPAHVPLWGVRVLIATFLAPETVQKHLILVAHLIADSWQIGLFLMVFLIWLRRKHRTVPEVCATIGMGYAVLFGIADTFAFQYFAWTVVFWFFCRRWFLVGASVLGGGFIYSLYWLLCGNPWLLGHWNFEGHPYWPPFIIIMRDCAMVFFTASGCWFLGSGIVEQFKSWWKQGR